MITLFCIACVSAMALEATPEAFLPVDVGKITFSHISFVLIVIFITMLIGVMDRWQKIKSMMSKKIYLYLKFLISYLVISSIWVLNVGIFKDVSVILYLGIMLTIILASNGLGQIRLIVNLLDKLALKLKLSQVKLE